MPLQIVEREVLQLADEMNQVSGLGIVRPAGCKVSPRLGPTRFAERNRIGGAARPARRSLASGGTGNRPFDNACMIDDARKRVF